METNGKCKQWIPKPDTIYELKVSDRLKVIYPYSPHINVINLKHISFGSDILRQDSDTKHIISFVF